MLAQYAQEKALTIHKRIYRQRTNADYESKYSLNFNAEKGAVFIVDEASMLSDSHAAAGRVFGCGSLLSKTSWSTSAAAADCRLVLVGDSAQLPPVGADRSPALDAGVAGPPTAASSTATMDEVVRQEARVGILFNATLVRVHARERPPRDSPHFEMGFPDIEAVVGGEFLEKLEDCYARYGRDETIVITRSNKRANRYNEGIRRNVLYAEEEIESGDMLMVVIGQLLLPRAHRRLPDELHRQRRHRAAETPQAVRGFRLGFRFADAVLEFPDYNDAEIECKILLDTIASESPSLTREESTRLFYEVEKDYTDIKSKLKRFKEIRENPHFNAVQVKFSYAVTCHKAQGGQWRRSSFTAACSATSRCRATCSAGSIRP